MQRQDRTSTFDKRAGLVSVIILAVFIFPITFVHELGHVMICALDGHSFEMKVSAYMASVICDGTSSNPMLYWAAGGLLAMLVASSPFVAWNWVRRNKGVSIGSLTIATGHGVNAIIETFSHSLYVTNISASIALIIIPTVIAYVIFLALFGRIKHDKDAVMRETIPSMNEFM